MSDNWTLAATRRAAWIGAAIAGVVVLVPAIPSVASAISPSDKAPVQQQPWVAHLEIVSPNVIPTVGQIRQPAAGTSIYVACGRGNAIGGGYQLGAGAKRPMTGSSPSADLKRWDFGYPGLVPVGTRFYAICSG